MNKILFIIIIFLSCSGNKKEFSLTSINYTMWKDFIKPTEKELDKKIKFLLKNPELIKNLGIQNKTSLKNSICNSKNSVKIFIKYIQKLYKNKILKRWDNNHLDLTFEKKTFSSKYIGSVCPVAFEKNFTLCFPTSKMIGG